jgi:hypothetical protein
VTALLLWIVRLVVLLIIVRLIVRRVSAAIGQRQAPKPSSRVPERAGGTLVRDPHCGTYLPESRALVVGRGANALHFCSSTCRDAWTAAHGGAGAKASHG